jgi:bifunctional DNA-binding transcriptional regulator/antitoxin component of YhaV-PrlF toxin-antitoxin module
LILPHKARKALGLESSAMLAVELGEPGSVILRKKNAPGFFDRFVGLKAKAAPFASGDEAREAFRVAESFCPRSGR